MLVWGFSLILRIRALICALSPLCFGIGLKSSSEAPRETIPSYLSSIGPASAGPFVILALFQSAKAYMAVGIIALSPSHVFEQTLPHPRRDVGLDALATSV